jgi:dihydrofolate synthase/folylpolyglutamate synthase
VTRRAAELGSPCWRLGREIVVESLRDGWLVETPVATRSALRPTLLGEYQGRNLACAVAAIDAAGLQVSDDAIRQGILSASLPGRLEVWSEYPAIYLDGAHNRQALEALMLAIAALHGGRTVRVVYSAAIGHDVAQSLAALEGAIVYSAPMNHPRSVDADALPNPYASVPDALSAAIAESGPEDVLVITGSFYLLSEARSWLRSHSRAQPVS